MTQIEISSPGKKWLQGVGSSLGYVTRLTRASNTNFYYAFLTLPKAERQAIIAVYAFCRTVDDAVDEAHDAREAEARLAWWRSELSSAFAGHASHPVALEAARAADRFELPPQLFEQVIQGVAFDLAPRRFETWEELARYCDLVAGAVGRLCVRIFGCREAWADDYAGALGHALQLTNILRDLGADGRAGRFYLPQDELRACGLSEAEILDPRHTRRAEYLGLQARRADQFYAQAARLAANAPRALCAAEVMRVIYTELLRRVERLAFPVETSVRVARLTKLSLAARTWWRCRITSGTR
jgi:phytoene synthase